MVPGDPADHDVRRHRLTAPAELVHAADAADAAWWRDAVIYQIYPRSWADADGDGIGDLPGITARLPYLRDLGVDADLVQPLLHLAAGRRRLRRRRLPRHRPAVRHARRRRRDGHQRARAGPEGASSTSSRTTRSDEHAWFRAALAAGPGSPERDRYIFRDGQGPDGEEPPEQLALGLRRPRLDPGHRGRRHARPVVPAPLRHQAARPELEATPRSAPSSTPILRFWLDRGIDGFRVDVAHGLVKREGLPDWHGKVGLYDEVDADTGPTGEGRDAEQVHSSSEGEVLDHTATGAAPMWDQDGVHEIYRGWRAVLDAYGAPDRILCAEAWVSPAHRLARYVRPDEMHQAFNFDFLDAHWDASALSTVIEASLRSNDGVGAPTTWVLSNHDVVRHASRLGLDQSLPPPQRHPRHRPAARCRARPAPGACCHGPHAGAARRRLRLPGRGARAARAPPTARLGPPGPDVPSAPTGGSPAVTAAGCRCPGSKGAPSIRVRPGRPDRGSPSPTRTPTSRSTSRRAWRARPSSSTARCSTTAAGTAPGTAASPGTR